MGNLTFKGGIHPPDMKTMTQQIPIVKLAPPKRIVIPLQQHIGALLEPIVKVGDNIKVGQKIGDSSAFISAPVHSSVSGKVIAIEPHYHPSGMKVPSIIIENDFEYDIYEGIKPLGDYKNLSPEAMVSAVREAGLVGMGGAAFPTHVKFSPPKDKKIESIIANGAECEPYLTSDHRVMLEYPDEVIYGLKSIMHIFGLNKGYIAVEENKADAIKTLKSKLKSDNSIEVISLETKYPQGSEKHLIKSVTGKEVPSGKLPADIGALVINIDTCRAMHNLIKNGMPLIKRIVTVSGSGINSPCNFEVSVGTDFKTLIDAAGGLKDNVKKLIMGGPMMGISQFNLKTPVIKGTSGLLALTNKEVDEPIEAPCTSCGKCVSGCPMGLMPLYLAKFGKVNDFDALERYSIKDCIECGSCSYVCPSKRQLVQRIRMAKQAAILNSKKNAKSVEKGR